MKLRYIRPIEQVIKPYTKSDREAWLANGPRVVRNKSRELRDMVAKNRKKLK